MHLRNYLRFGSQIGLPQSSLCVGYGWCNGGQSCTSDAGHEVMLIYAPCMWFAFVWHTRCRILHLLFAGLQLLRQRDCCSSTWPWRPARVHCIQNVFCRCASFRLSCSLFNFLPALCLVKVSSGCEPAFSRHVWFRPGLQNESAVQTCAVLMLFNVLCVKMYVHARVCMYVHTYSMQSSM
jgi:hypothetical protein